MKRSTILSVLLGSLFFFTQAIAAPVVWTIPQTPMSDGSTISGSFTYDTAATPPLSAINIVKTAPNAETYNLVGASDSVYIRAAASAGNNQPAIYLIINGIPAAGGTLTQPANTVGIGFCDQTAGCPNVLPGGGGYISNIASIAYTALAPAAAAESIPTLSEWAMIFMASLMGMFAYGTLRRR